MLLVIRAVPAVLRKNKKARAKGRELRGTTFFMYPKDTPSTVNAGATFLSNDSKELLQSHLPACFTADFHHPSAL